MQLARSNYQTRCFARGVCVIAGVVATLEIVGLVGRIPATATTTAGNRIQRLMTAVESSSRAPSAATTTTTTTMHLGPAQVRTITRIKTRGHYVLQQTITPLQTRCFARGNIITGVVAA
ncbi:hypothetical protein HN011_005690, partial [Eciton burchellii]